MKRIVLPISILFLLTTFDGFANPREIPPGGLRHLFSKHGGIFLLDYDRTNKLINQTEGFDRTDRLQLDDYRNGFRYIQNVTAGFGGEAIFNYPFPYGSIGFDVMVSGMSSFDRFAATPEDARALPPPKLPSRAHDLESWKVGDNVIYQSSGGVGFALGAGNYHVLGTAVYFFAKGDWIIYVEKTQGNTVFLKLTSIRLLSLGVLAKSIIAGIGVDRFGSADQGFSFSYNLNNREAALAYEDAIRGNLVPSEEMVEIGDGRVVRVISTTGGSSGFVKSTYFGIPFLIVRSTDNGRVYSSSNLIRHWDGSRTESNSSLHLRHKTVGGHWSPHSIQIADFLGTHTITSKEVNQYTKAHTGQYLWAYESMKMSSKKLRGKLWQLSNQTGIESLKEIGVPPQKWLGYLNLQFKAEIPENTIDSLMVWANSQPEQSPPDLFPKQREKMKEICSIYPPYDPVNQTDQSTLSAEECEKRWVTGTQKEIETMIFHLKAMSNTLDSNVPSFTKHLGEFGKHMATNQFTFSGVLSLTRTAPIKMELTMEGERISKFKKDVPYPEFDGRPLIFSGDVSPQVDQ